jgi:uncharacterized protein
MSIGTFRKQIILEAGVKDVFIWHARPGAIERLSPPWDPLQVVYQSGGIEEGAEVVLKMRAGPLKYNWHARHTAYQENHLFADEQTRGPFACWKHTHRFTSAGDGNRCLLEDAIDYRPPLAAATLPLIKGVVNQKLDRIFAYRHLVTAADLALHLKYRDRSRKTVLISGASGLIGARLIPLLTTGGHNVIKLVRRQPVAPNEVFWDPAKNWIDKDSLNKRGIDAVIHLAGENVGTGRWTAAKKEEIVQSREKGTALLVNTMAELKHRPRSFLSASAIGLYGHCQDTALTEADGPGEGFLADVCRRWEASAQNNSCQDIRTVLMRIGVVLTPEGGALQRLILPFSLGLGGRIGSGQQYLSWISIDDALGAIYHLLMEDTISGPVNLVSPAPVTNAMFTQTLAEILSRPTMLPLPARLIQLLFGQMGREVLLTSTRVHPERLLETGYSFRHRKIKASLRHLLGKPLAKNPPERNCEAS